MSLSYDLSQVAQSTKDEWSEDAGETQAEEAWAKAVTVIQWCMATGIGEITEKNVAEWYARYLLLNATLDFAPYLRLTDVRKLIGLKTNVAFESAASLRKRAYENVLRDVESWNSQAVMDEKDFAVKQAAAQAAENWTNQTDPGAPSWEQEHHPVEKDGRTVCSCGDFNCASLDA
jgi:hypothetical protein